MFKKLILLCYGLLWVTFAHASTTTTIDRTYVSVTNNTDQVMILNPMLYTNDTDFKRGIDWNSEFITLAPYETKEVLWFSRNTHVKKNQSYRFDLRISPSPFTENLIVSLSEVGNSVLGSTLTTELTLPQQEKQVILTKNGLENFSGNFWNNPYSFYARTWQPTGHAYNDFHFVIHKNENHSYYVPSNQIFSVLTYNTQLMPFYAGVVNDLNQPDLRAKEIPAYLPSSDVIILQELFDHDLRSNVIDAMHANYPYHTQVVGHGTSKILTGGIMIFSKWPIVKEDQMIFQASTGIDRFAAKGVAYAVINKNGKIYHVMGTHLQADDNQESVYARQKQLQEMRNFIERLNIPNDQPLLIGGDFNINQFSQESNSLFGILPVNSIDHLGYLYSIDNTINTMAAYKDRARIDYVFYSTAHTKPMVAFNHVFILRALNNEKMWPKFDLSDHFPVVSYFDFSPY